MRMLNKRLGMFDYYYLLLFCIIFIPLLCCGDYVRMVWKQ